MVLQRFAMRVAVAAAPRVPAAFGYRVSAAVADVAHAVSRGRRRQLEANLRQAVGQVTEERLSELSRAAFRNLVWNYFELFHLAGAGLDQLRPNDQVEGAERFAEVAASTTTGVVMAFAHVGSIEAFSQISQLHPEYRFVVVVEHMDDPATFELLSDIRGRQGMELIRADEPRRLLTALREGAHVAIAADLDTTGTGIVVDLLGRPARVPTGPVRLSLLTGAPLVVAEAWRTDPTRPGRFQSRVGQPLALEGSATDQAAVRAGVEQVIRCIEKQIVEHPEQWLAFRDVWEADR